ncbi:metal-sensing transcriptional repressor [Sphingomonas sp. NPDC085925]|uniref:metal-sensing transcriptional repressor n=1 Tax=unclassified Sphingomonas TaxID=196159 RepID=UPI003D05A0BC
MAHTISNKDQLLARVRRIAGQVAAIEKAIASEAGCATILHQVAGVRGAVGGLSTPG